MGVKLRKFYHIRLSNIGIPILFQAIIEINTPTIPFIKYSIIRNQHRLWRLGRLVCIAWRTIAMQYAMRSNSPIETSFTVLLLPIAPFGSLRQSILVCSRSADCSSSPKRNIVTNHLKQQHLWQNYLYNLNSVFLHEVCYLLFRELWFPFRLHNY